MTTLLKHMLMEDTVRQQEKEKSRRNGKKTGRNRKVRGKREEGKEKCRRGEG